MSERAFLFPGAASGPPGPHRASQVREGDRVELSNGRKIECQPAGVSHGAASVLGGAVLASDPATKGRVGADVGIQFNDDKNLRAPDTIVGTSSDRGWQRTPPPLAVEYAGVGQNEEDLRDKIAELLEFGIKIIWVVRITGPLCVEVHTREGMRLVAADEELHAPGILANPVPVRAFVDPEVALAATTRNLLSAYGARSIDELRADERQEGKLEGKAEGKAEGRLEGRLDALLLVLRERGLSPTAEHLEVMRRCQDPALLQRWLLRALRADAVDQVLAP